MASGDNTKKVQDAKKSVAQAMQEATKFAQEKVSGEWGLNLDWVNKAMTAANDVTRDSMRVAELSTALFDGTKGLNAAISDADVLIPIYGAVYVDPDGKAHHQRMPVILDSYENYADWGDRVKNYLLEYANRKTENRLAAKQEEVDKIKEDERKEKAKARQKKRQDKKAKKEAEANKKAQEKARQQNEEARKQREEERKQEQQKLNEQTGATDSAVQEAMEAIKVSAALHEAANEQLQKIRTDNAQALNQLNGIVKSQESVAAKMATERQALQTALNGLYRDTSVKSIPISGQFGQTITNMIYEDDAKMNFFYAYFTDANGEVISSEGMYTFMLDDIEYKPIQVTAKKVSYAGRTVYVKDLSNFQGDTKVSFTIPENISADMRRFVEKRMGRVKASAKVKGVGVDYDTLPDSSTINLNVDFCSFWATGKFSPSESEKYQATELEIKEGNDILEISAQNHYTLSFPKVQFQTLPGLKFDHTSVATFNTKVECICGGPQLTLNKSNRNVKINFENMTLAKDLMEANEAKIASIKSDIEALESKENIAKAQQQAAEKEIKKLQNTQAAADYIINKIGQLQRLNTTVTNEKTIVDEETGEETKVTLSYDCLDLPSYEKQMSLVIESCKMSATYKGYKEQGMDEAMVDSLVAAERDLLVADATQDSASNIVFGAAKGVGVDTDKVKDFLGLQSESMPIIASGDTLPTSENELNDFMSGLGDKLGGKANDAIDKLGSKINGALA